MNAAEAIPIPIPIPIPNPKPRRSGNPLKPEKRFANAPVRIIICTSTRSEGSGDAHRWGSSVTLRPGPGLVSSGLDEIAF